MSLLKRAKKPVIYGFFEKEKGEKKVKLTRGEKKRKTRTLNYFKRVQQLLVEKRSRYDSVYLPEDRAKLKDIIHLLVEVEEYLKHLDFLTDDGRKRIEVYYHTMFNVKLACEELGLTRDSFDKFLSRTNNRLHEKLTDKFLHYIENEMYNDALLEFRLSTRKFKTTGILMMDFLNALPDEQPKQSYKLTDCRDELQLLRLYSHHAMETNIGRMNREKLIYLLYVLTSGASLVTYESELLANYLQGNLRHSSEDRELTFKEFIEDLMDRGL